MVHTQDRISNYNLRSNNRGPPQNVIKKEIDLLELSTALGSIDQWPASRWNPRGLRQNCVFVTCGYMLGIPANVLMQKSGLNDSDFPAGVDWRVREDGYCQGLIVLQHIERYMKGSSLAGNSWAWESYQFFSQLHRNGHPVSPEEQARHASKCNVEIRGLLTQHKLVGVGFHFRRREESPGHCLIARKIVPDKGHPEGVQFVCYQSSTEGKDLTEHVRAAEALIAFAFRGAQDRGTI